MRSKRLGRARRWGKGSRSPWEVRVGPAQQHHETADSIWETASCLHTCGPGLPLAAGPSPPAPPLPSTLHTLASLTFTTARYFPVLQMGEPAQRRSGARPRLQRAVSNPGWDPGCPGPGPVPHPHPSGPRPQGPPGRPEGALSTPGSQHPALTCTDRPSVNACGVREGPNP